MLDYNLLLETEAKLREEGKTKITYKIKNDGLNR